MTIDERVAALEVQMTAANAALVAISGNLTGLNIVANKSNAIRAAEAALQAAKTAP